VVAAHWLADQEAKPEGVYQLWTRTGFTFARHQEDWSNESRKYKTSPLIDPYLYARYSFQIFVGGELDVGALEQGHSLAAQLFHRLDG
jgi:hypothetical protein